MKVRPRYIAIGLLLFIGLLLSACCFAQGKKDTAYWNHINNRRLEFRQANVTRTGVVEKIYYERDGDLHLWIKYRGSLLNVEIICYKPSKDCAGYTNRLKKPRIGDKVEVTGDLVLDRAHGWLEIHPAKSIVLLKAAPKKPRKKPAPKKPTDEKPIDKKEETVPQDPDKDGGQSNTL